MRGIWKRFPGVIGEPGRRPRAEGRRSARAARRERRGQVHPDAHPLRHVSPRCRDHPPRRAAGRVPVSCRGHRGGNRHGAPAFPARGGADRGREHPPGVARHAVGRRGQRAERADGQAMRGIRAARRSCGADLAAFDGRAAARRNPARPFARRAGADPRRTHLSANPCRGRRTVPGRALAGCQRPHGRVDQPQAGRGACGLGRGDGVARGTGGCEPPHPGVRPAHARKPVDRPGNRLAAEPEAAAAR